MDTSVEEKSKELKVLWYAQEPPNAVGWTGKLEMFGRKHPQPLKNLQWSVPGFRNRPELLPEPPNWVQELTVYGKMLQLLSTSDTYYMITAPTGTGKTIGTIAALLRHHQLKKEKDFKVLFILPNRLTAKRVYELFRDKLFCAQRYQPVGIVTSEMNDYQPETKILIVTPGIAQVSVRNSLDFTHVVIDEAHCRTLQLLYVLDNIYRNVQSSEENDVKIIMLTASEDQVAPIVQKFPFAKRIRVSKPLTIVTSTIFWPEFMNNVEITGGGATTSKLTQLAYDYDLGEFSANHDMDAILRMAYQVVKFIISGTVEGDILVFLPGKAEIGKLRKYIKDDPSIKDKACIDQLFSSFWESEEIQARANSRKVILATNVAESSVTLPDVIFVVDTMYHRYPEPCNFEGFVDLRLHKIGPSNAIQRKGRAGRVAPGWYFPLMFKHDYDQLMESQTHILSHSEEPYNHMLMLLDSDLQFDTMQGYVDPVPNEIVQTGIKVLTSQGMVEYFQGKYVLTDIGRTVANIVWLSPEEAMLLLIGTALGFQPWAKKFCANAGLDFPIINHTRRVADESFYDKNISLVMKSEHIVMVEGYVQACDELKKLELKFAGFNTKSSPFYAREKTNIGITFNVKGVELANELEKKINTVLDRIGLNIRSDDLYAREPSDLLKLVAIVGAFGNHTGTVKEDGAKGTRRAMFTTKNGHDFQSETSALRQVVDNHICVYNRAPVFGDGKSFTAVTAVKPYFFCCFGAVGNKCTYENGECILRGSRDADPTIVLAMSPSLFRIVQHIRIVLLEMVFHSKERPIFYAGNVRLIEEIAELLLDFDIPADLDGGE